MCNVWLATKGKHTNAKNRRNHTAPNNELNNKDDCLPIVTVRNPFDWMTSMCKLSYTAKWSMRERGKTGDICPHLVYTNSTSEKLVPVQLKVKLAEKWLSYRSLAHLWNEW